MLSLLKGLYKRIMPSIEYYSSVEEEIDRILTIAERYVFYAGLDDYLKKNEVITSLQNSAERGIKLDILLNDKEAYTNPLKKLVGSFSNIEVRLSPRKTKSLIIADGIHISFPHVSSL